MGKVEKKFVQTILLGYIALVFGASYASNALAIELNDYALDVKVLSHGNDFQGTIPVFALVTYAGAGIDILAAENFSANMDAQLVPAGCSALTLDTNSFQNKGDGVYHLALKPVTTLCAGNYYLPLKVDMRVGFGIKASGMAVLEIFRFSFNLN